MPFSQPSFIGKSYVLEDLTITHGGYELEPTSFTGGTTYEVNDIDELRTWRMDIREVLTANMIRDMIAEQDSRFIAAVNTALLLPISAPEEGQRICRDINIDKHAHEILARKLYSVRIELGTRNIIRD
jgi:hypothetical protein